MEVGPLVVLGLMWVVLNALRKGGVKPTDRPRTPPAQPSAPGQPTPSRAKGLPPARGPAGLPPRDATQREGVQLEQLLRDLGRTLDEGRGSGRQPQVRRLPSAGGAGSERSLEVEPQVQSLEAASAEGERAVVDQDDEAERLEQRRIAAAEANQRALTEADHEAFERRIRQEPADKTATRGYTTRQLRQAMVWREILGPPVSLRGDDPREG
jgi:hypothetical protein